MLEKPMYDDPALEPDANGRWVADSQGMMKRDECVFKKCCKKYKRKGKHCRRCPKL